MSPLNLPARVYGRVVRRAGRVHGNGPLLLVIGDSHTDPRTGYTLPWQVWVRIVGRAGYQTFNLGVSGDTTTDMRRRIVQLPCERTPEIGVLFGGSNDPARGIDPTETVENVTFMVDWFKSRGVQRIVLIGPGLRNSTPSADRLETPLDDVQRALEGVAAREGVTFVDLAGFLRGRLDRGDDPDFARTPYRQSRSWHIKDHDPHFNAYGQRLIAEAFLSATADWRPHRPAGTTQGRA
jgi:lysophospholipase L1-like esterase